MKSDGIMNFDNIDSGNGLMPDGTKPLPEPKLTYLQYALLKHISWPIVSHISDGNKFEYKVFKMSPGPNEWRHFRSPETWLYIKKKSSAICHTGPLSGDSIYDWWFSTQRATNMKKVAIWHIMASSWLLSYCGWVTHICISENLDNHYIR